MIKATRTHLIIFLLIFASACSIQSWKEPSPEVKVTLVKVSAAFLTGVLQNDRGVISGFASLNDIYKHNRITEQTFFTRVKALQNTFSDASHPLVGLKVVEIKQFDSDARIILQKADGSSTDKIELGLFWANSGWLVTDESLTKDGGLIQKLTGV